MQELQERLEVGTDPGEVSRARALTRRFVGGLPDPPVDLIDTAVLLVSELVTNAVVHTGRSAVLRLEILPAPGAAHRHPPVRPSPGGGRAGRPVGTGERRGAPVEPVGAGGCAVCGKGATDGSGPPAAGRAPVVLRIEVVDRTLRPPCRREAGDEDTSGRGLELVQALAHRWGWRPHPGGKRIWCELDCSAGGPVDRVDRRIPAGSRRPPAT
ncbi:hypothetical protein GCM10027160_13480 [Streptomyces calidiresistens]|uniref:ATP-binding protein n=1 Tax=Streptomyces calidiresistens TaxID=1485586 RepID=A0A7W3T672_9ACTN|nr:ATP-binding protein [Streptomyces calidiresistens]MBB0231677.1 hypothetical protein [Streptomyces calidiresistens]